VGLPPEGFVAALAATLGYEVLPMAEMDRLDVVLAPTQIIRIEDQETGGLSQA
jgi:hypothetical protein